MILDGASIVIKNDVDGGVALDEMKLSKEFLLYHPGAVVA